MNWFTHVLSLRVCCGRWHRWPARTPRTVLPHHPSPIHDREASVVSLHLTCWPQVRIVVSAPALLASLPDHSSIQLDLHTHTSRATAPTLEA